MGELRRDGAQLFAGAALGCVVQIAEAIKNLPADKAGSRIAGNAKLAALLDASGTIGQHVAPLLGAKARPVRAVLFNKTPQANWPLGWHQDRTICVQTRSVLQGFENWSVKQGLHHVEPPFSIMETMVTVRIHLDPVSEDNAPLLVALGTHKMGRIEVAEVGKVVRASRLLQCLAQPGDIWAYSTPILHASHAVQIPNIRRVLQVDYSADELPGGLEWKGV